MPNDVIETTRDRIRVLNDNLRVRGEGGTVLVTAGVAALGADPVRALRTAVAQFDAFNADNDPHEEHDCAVMEFDGERIIWKIDYYDQRMEGHSPDPSQPDMTERVLTIMLAEEY